MKKALNLENLKYPIGKFQKPISISENNLKNWISVIENFPEQLKTLTNNLSIEQLNWSYRPEGWSVKQVIHHCADSHMNSFIRFKLALTESNPTIKPYDETKWAELSDGNSDDIFASLQIIDGIHKRWVLFLNSFDESHFKRTFYHPENKISYQLDAVIGLYAWHCNHHFAHIKQALFYENKF